MLEIGSYVDGKYKVLNKVGQGGMSVVYLAMNEKANKQWAIKEVRRDSVEDYDMIKKRLVIETELLRKLGHPSLPSVVDVIEDEDSFLIVMDYIQGNPLMKTLEEYGAQPEEYVIEWAKQLCDVLAYLHTRKPPVIYRDMKPSNVMLRPDGNLTLIDFGAAGEFARPDEADAACLGTEGYAAPEQFDASAQTDARTDIYGLGATLYHLVTGWNPCFPYNVMKPIREVNPLLSVGLEKIILKCTERSPDERYQSAAELMYDLEHYDVMDEAYQKKQKRKFLRFAVAAILALLFAVVGVAGSVMAERTANSTYSVRMGEANELSDLAQKKKVLLEAINILPGEAEAYLQLVQVYKADYDFTIEENEELTKIILMNKSELVKNSEKYAKLSLEIGRLYWYYFSYGNTKAIHLDYDYANAEESKLTRMTNAVPWFEDALEYGGESFSEKQLALVCREIACFYRDIKGAQWEGSDKGMYLSFWNNLKSLSEMVEEDGEEIVRRELYEATRNAIQRYAGKLKSDGITEADMVETYEQVAVRIRELYQFEDIEAAETLDNTRIAIAIAFGTLSDVTSGGMEP